MKNQKQVQALVVNCIRLLCLIVSLTAVSVANAGEYRIVSMNGGTAAGSNGTQEYIGTNGTRGYTPPIFIQGAPLSINYSGAITTTFQWVTDDPTLDPPPGQVIVDERCDVRLNASIYGPGSFTIEDGFGATQSITSWGGASLNTSRITKQQGSTFTITCEPKIAGFSPAFGSLFPSLTYSVRLVYPRISVEMTRKIGGKDIIAVGANMRAKVGIVGAIDEAKITTNSWDVGNDKSIPDLAYNGFQTEYEWYYYKGSKLNGLLEKQNIYCVVVWTYRGLTTTNRVNKLLFICGPQQPSPATVVDNSLGQYSETSAFSQRTFSADANHAAISCDAVGWVNPRLDGANIWSGKVFWAQLVNVDASRHYLGVDLVMGSTNGEYWLDNSFPYSDKGTLFEDSPEYSFLTSNVAYAHYNIAAKTYLYWEPDAIAIGQFTHPVMIGKFSWYWNNSNRPNWLSPVGSQGADATVAAGMTEKPTWWYVFSNR